MRMVISKKQIILLVTLLAAIVLLAVLPLVFIINAADSHWQGVVPAGYVADSEFYIIQMIKGTSSFPFGNNPFFIERTNEFNPALIGANYIAAIPLKLGLSLITTLIFNSIFWNMVFIIFLWLFLRRLGAITDWIFFLIPFVYLSVYGAMIRPVVWQTVLPFFMFFLYTFSIWLESQSSVSKILLAVGVAGTFYVYPYTWQITFLILGLYFVWFLINRKWQMVRSEFQILALALVIALPALFYLYKVISSPLFPEFLKNIGSIKTHLPSKVSFELVRWVIVNLFLWHMVARFMPKIGKDKKFNLARGLFSAHGLAIFILAFSPIITGRDGAIGDHLGRELFFWLSISVATVSFFVFSDGYFKQQIWVKKFIILLLLLINIFPIAKHYKRSFLQPFQRSGNEIINVQDYAKPIAWLDKYEKDPTVVWASSNIAGLIPILSKHYSPEPPDLAYQYWNNQKEIQERYLISQYFNDSTPELFFSSTALGLSYFRQFDDLRWKAELCQKLKFIVFKGCVPKTSGLTLSELAYRRDREISELMEVNEKEIRPRIVELLKKYHVAYVVKDLVNDKSFHVEKFKNTREIYNDARFVIFKFGN